MIFVSKRKLLRRPARRARERILMALLLALVAAIVFFRPEHGPREIEIIVTEAARRHAVPRDLVAAVIRAESGGDPAAVSRKGAMGLMQLMPVTAEWLAPQVGRDVPSGKEAILDPEFNVDVGTFYLSKLIRRYGGNETLALAAYNSGPTNVDRWRKENPGLSGDALVQAAAFEETRTYVSRVRRYR
jgi:soluble lytic murein transglycosylase